MASEGIVPIPNLTLQEQVYAELKRQILDGLLAPGQIITIRAIAIAMGTSVMPVREAIQRLIADQAFVATANRSISVPLLSRDDFLELSSIRRELEGLAAARVAEFATDEDIACLEQKVGSIREAIRDRDADRLLLENRTFCFCIQDYSQSSYLATLVKGLWLRLGPTRRVAYRSLFKADVTYENLVRSREALILALRSRNPDDARNAVIEDISAGIPFILKFGVFVDSDDAAQRIAG